MERVQVVMLKNKDSLFAGEKLNLPEQIAKQLISAGEAELVSAPGPQETKVVAPAEVKEVKVATAAEIVKNKKTRK